jgi:Bacterial PH domain
VITDEQIARGKDGLPRGWGRFGKALDYLQQASGPDESLLATCIGINPDFQMRSGTLHTLVGVERFVSNYFQDTNLLLAATDQRIIAVATGVTGGPRGHTEIPYEGLEITRQDKKELELSWPGGSLRLKGIHKKVLPEFADAVRSQVVPRAT